MPRGHCIRAIRDAADGVAGPGWLVKKLCGHLSCHGISGAAACAPRDSGAALIVRRTAFADENRRRRFAQGALAIKKNHPHGCGWVCQHCVPDGAGVVRSLWCHWRQASVYPSMAGDFQQNTSGWRRPLPRSPYIIRTARVAPVPSRWRRPVLLMDAAPGLYQSVFDGVGQSSRMIDIASCLHVVASSPPRASARMRTDARC